MDTDTHTCSYYCERPECIRRQRDELRRILEDDGHSYSQQTMDAVAGERDKLREENAALLAANRDSMDHFNALRFDYDALRKRIDDAPTVEVALWSNGIELIVDRGTREGVIALDGKSVRLVRDDE